MEYQNNIYKFIDNNIIYEKPTGRYFGLSTQKDKYVLINNENNTIKTDLLNDIITEIEQKDNLEKRL